MNLEQKLEAIGVVELNSIAAGMQVTDTMLKSADVQLMLSRSICSGKYMVMVGGTASDVQASVETGTHDGGTSVIDSTVIANIHPSVFKAIAGSAPPADLVSLGVIESFSVASLIEAADTAVKSANVQLLEIRLAMALGGKAFVTMTGEVAGVRAAVENGASVVADKGLLVNKVVIAAPRRELFKDYI
jgi:microcompartment protein CcmL/EutN